MSSRDSKRVTNFNLWALRVVWVREELLGHTPSTAGTFRKKFRKDSGKTPEPGNALRAFPGIPVESTAGMSQPLSLKAFGGFQSISRIMSPPSTAWDASFFRSGSGEGLSEPVMEFPAVLGAFLNYTIRIHRFILARFSIANRRFQATRFRNRSQPDPSRLGELSGAMRLNKNSAFVSGILKFTGLNCSALSSFGSLCELSLRESLCQKNPRVRKIFVRDSGAGNGCVNFMDAWKNAFFLQEKAMSIKFLVLGGGGDFGFWGVGGGVPILYLWARGFF